MNIDQRILREIKRHREINRYIFEQELPPPPAEEGGELPPPPPAEGGATPPPAGGTDPNAAVTPEPPTGPQPVDVENDPEVEKLDDKKVKEIEVTDLVKSQKNVDTKQEEFFNNLFGHLNDLEEKLSAMDDIMNKLNSLESKIEKYRVKTPEEKLELRSLDSGPFNQKLSDFFDEKEEDMEMSGKNEYVLTSDEIKNYSPHEVKRSFRDFNETEMTPENDVSKFKKIY